MENPNRSRKIIILNQFKNSAHEISQDIRIDSPQNALKFINGLPIGIQTIHNHPFVYPKAHSKLSSRYRFNIYMKSWKIVFKVLNDTIIFLDIIHVRKHPREILKLRTTQYD